MGTVRLKQSSPDRWCALMVALGIAMMLGSERAAAETPATPALEELVRTLEEQKHALDEQQKRITEQEKKLDEYKAALERALAEQKLRLRQLESQRGAGTRAGSGSSAVDSQVASNQSQADSDKPVKDKPVGAAPENSNRPPDIAPITSEYPGVLTPRGKLILEPALQYSHSSNDRVALTGFTIIPAIVIGNINIQHVNRDLFVSSLAARYGLTDRFEIEGKVPYVYRQDSTTARELLQQSFNDQVFNAQGSGLGDTEFTGRYQLNKGGPDSAYYVGALRFKTTTGKGPFDVPTVSPVPGVFVQSQLPTGTGFYALQPSLTALFPSDPAVFFVGASYIWNIKRHVNDTIGTYDPGDGFTVNFGMGLALNERASFSVGYEHDVFFKDKQNGQYVVNAQTEHLGTLLIGYSYRFSQRFSFNLSLGAGLTPDAPDVTITARFPYTF